MLLWELSLAGTTNLALTAKKEDKIRLNFYYCIVKNSLKGPKTNLPPVNADPFAAPKVDEATKIGITQAITP